jgi:hypothetical protein
MVSPNGVNYSRGYVRSPIRARPTRRLCGCAIRYIIELQGFLATLILQGLHHFRVLRTRCTVSWTLLNSTVTQLLLKVTESLPTKGSSTKYSRSWQLRFAPTHLMTSSRRLQVRIERSRFVWKPMERTTSPAI